MSIGCKIGCGLDEMLSFGDIDEPTPVERRGDIMAKRDDLFVRRGANGGKLRCAAYVVRIRKPSGLVSSGSRGSLGGVAVAAAASEAGISCEFHVPEGPTTPEQAAAEALGAKIVRHRAGRNTLLRARSQERAAELGWALVPFGMECWEMVWATRRQVCNLPFGAFKRLVVPVGGGMSLAGILWGLRDCSSVVPVLGVRVGSRATGRRLDTFGPPSWRRTVSFVDAPQAYGESVKDAQIGGLALDPLYEAKALPFLAQGDLLWIVASREGKP